MITIYELKRLNLANGGHFFSKGTMKFFGDTMRNFRVEKTPTPGVVKVSRKKSINLGANAWLFDEKTGLTVKKGEA